MKKIHLHTLALFGLAAYAAPLVAEEVTLVGVMSCEKCNLKQAEDCSDALQIGETLYHLEEDGKRRTSEHVCSGTSAAKVTGTIEERDGKQFIVVSAIEAADEVTVAGVMSCEKCHLKQAEACSDALQIGEVLYHLEEDGKRRTSEHVCSGTAGAEITGTVENRDGQAFIVVSKIEIKE
jgi:hypothetical protein